MWKQWVIGILGVLVLLYPFFGLSIDGLTTLLVITGIVIAVLGFWGAGVASGKKLCKTCGVPAGGGEGEAPSAGSEAGEGSGM